MLPPAPADGRTDPFAAVRAALAGLVVSHCTPVTPTQFAEILAAAERCSRRRTCWRSKARA
jgi:hypothetical protein